MLSDLYGKKVVLFGAGQNGKYIFERLVKEGITPAYFVDNNHQIKHVESDAIGGGRVDVKTPDSLLSENKDDLSIIVTPAEPLRTEIEEQIEKMGLSEYICQNPLAYYSCSYINDGYMLFHGFLQDSKFALCCEARTERPNVPFCATPKETIDELVKCYSEVLAESKLQTAPRTFTTGCVKCPQYVLEQWNNDGLIHNVNFSFIPSPCQAKCIYCSVRPQSGVERQYCSPEIEERYKYVLSIVQYADDSGLIAPDAMFVVTSGEITIHPYKEAILDFIGIRRAYFCTNCFIYDERIGANLTANPKSCINLSIDAGTPETWRKVKGFDNFDDILRNLSRYYEAGPHPGQIEIKYIILPGINDSDKDYASVIEIMKSLNVTHVILSSDHRGKYNRSAEKSETLAQSAGRFAAMLKRLCQKP